MAELNIVSFGDAGAVVLTAELMKSAGLQVGDIVAATVVDRQLILRAPDQTMRPQLFKEIVQDLLELRGDAYQRLA